jgi:ADP-heptose:LPS heptosyltransferase
VGASNLLGKTTLREVANLLHQSTVIVGNDSGLFHLAQGVGCPAIGIFGPTSPQFTGVFRSTSAATLQANLPCMPCYQDTCHFTSDLPKPCCMSDVSVGQVMRKITELASQTQPNTLNSSL